MSGRILALMLALSGTARAFELDEHFHGVETALPDGTSKLYPDPRVWGFTFWPGLQSKESYGDGTNWLAGNGECQTYVTPLTSLAKSLPAADRYDPFTIDGDGLHIRAAVLTPAQRAAYKAGSFRRFGSGMLISRSAIRYGTVRMVARFPAASGSWPGLWLLPANHAWPPEIDVFEAMPWGPHAHELHSGLILPKGEGGAPGRWFKVDADLTGAFHTYGLSWTASQIEASFDGKPLWQAPTPPSLQQDMVLLVTFAVGGKWPFNELGVAPNDSLEPARLASGADRIEHEYPSDMVIREIAVTSP